VLGVRRWRELLVDREKWNDIVRQAKAHSGLQCQWNKKKIFKWCSHLFIFIVNYSADNTYPNNISIASMNLILNLFTLLKKFISAILIFHI